MRFHIITLFSEMFAPLMNCGVSGRAFRDGIASAKFWNPRDFCEDARANTDDRPFGGGSGMVMRPPPLADAIRAMRKECDAPLIFLSPQGKIFNHADSRRFAQAESLALLCGRYRGIDERIIRQFADEEISLGDFVLSGGEFAAMAVMDSVLRLRPGVLGNPESAGEDSFAIGDFLLDSPCYTRPEIFEGEKVPPPLLSGDHSAIRRWRLEESIRRTWNRRPELIRNAILRGKISAEMREIMIKLSINPDSELR